MWEVRQRGLDVGLSTEAGHAPEQIWRTAAARNVDLIVQPESLFGSFRPVVNRNDTFEAVQGAPCPLLIVEDRIIPPTWSFSAFHFIEAIFLHIPHAEERTFLRIPLRSHSVPLILFSVFHPGWQRHCSLPMASSQHSAVVSFQNEEQPRESATCPTSIGGGLIVESPQSVVQGCSAPGRTGWSWEEES
jgi:hypothetical protein